MYQSKMIFAVFATLFDMMSIIKSLMSGDKRSENICDLISPKIVTCVSQDEFNEVLVIILLSNSLLKILFDAHLVLSKHDEG